MKRIFLVSLGWVSVVLGVIGIFLPIMPTTPFILLGAWCFSRSSEHFHSWLHDHPRLGPIVQAWEDGNGLPRKVRNRVIFLLWLSMTSSSLIIFRWEATLFLVCLGAGVTFYLLRLPIQEETVSEQPLLEAPQAQDKQIIGDQS